jgi:hypothetical protein
VAEAGICSPMTCEKLTPPRSNRLAFLDQARDAAAALRAVPGVAQEGLPSAASSSPTMRSCRPVKKSRMAATSIGASGIGQLHRHHFFALAAAELFQLQASARP